MHSPFFSVNPHPFPRQLIDSYRPFADSLPTGRDRFSTARIRRTRRRGGWSICLFNRKKGAHAMGASHPDSSKHIVLAPLFLICNVTFAEGAERMMPGLIELRTDRIVAFKNGYALYIRKAEGVVDEAGKVDIHEVPMRQCSEACGPGVMTMCWKCKQNAMPTVGHVSEGAVRSTVLRQPGAAIRGEVSARASYRGRAGGGPAAADGRG